jgi:hypothetical protein
MVVTLAFPSQRYYAGPDDACAYRQYEHQATCLQLRWPLTQPLRVTYQQLVKAF